MFFARQASAYFPLLFFSTFLMSVVCIPPTMAQPCLPDGDVNQDGRITPTDGLLAFRHFLRMTESLLDTC